MCPAVRPQTTTYTTRFDPVYADNTVTVTPFFSPDHSIGTLTDLISSVSMGGTIEIGTPGSYRVPAYVHVVLLFTPANVGGHRVLFVEWLHSVHRLPRLQHHQRYQGAVPHFPCPAERCARAESHGPHSDQQLQHSYVPWPGATLVLVVALVVTLLTRHCAATCLVWNRLPPWTFWFSTASR